ncbi:hypothetical protein NIES4103_65650 [Nostoc sp. NIES-4103]|nr:hypothetical protein NIES4103_65650 [Nostoc sp. NIES-4103]
MVQALFRFVAIKKKHHKALELVAALTNITVVPSGEELESWPS